MLGRASVFDERITRKNCRRRMPQTHPGKFHVPDCTRKHDSCFFGPGAPPDTPKRAPAKPKHTPDTPKHAPDAPWQVSHARLHEDARFVLFWPRGAPRHPNASSHTQTRPRHTSPQAHPNTLRHTQTLLVSIAWQVSRARLHEEARFVLFWSWGAPDTPKRAPDTPKHAPDTPKQRFCLRGPHFVAPEQRFGSRGPHFVVPEQRFCSRGPHFVIPEQRFCSRGPPFVIPEQRFC